MVALIIQFNLALLTVEEAQLVLAMVRLIPIQPATAAKERVLEKVQLIHKMVRVQIAVIVWQQLNVLPSLV